MIEPGAQLTILGLGPGHARLLTLEGRKVLQESDEVWLRTTKHPGVGFLLRRRSIHSFDDLYESQPSAEEAEAAVAIRVIALAKRPGGVLLAVPGHPLVDDSLTRRVLPLAEADGLIVRVIAGLSFLDQVYAQLHLDPAKDGLQTVNATSLAVLAGDSDVDDDRWPSLLATPPLRATVPALVAQLSCSVFPLVERGLRRWYPASHSVTLVRLGRNGQTRKHTFPLAELGHQPKLDGYHFLYLPPLPQVEDLASFSTLRHIIARLRAPGGCPWDREQNHQSLKPYLIEECYEVLEALDDADWPHLEEELGDLLLQIVLHAQLAAEAREFDMSGVLARISAKLIRRHPHVFGDRVVSDSSEVLRNWEQIKRAERGEKEAAKKTLLGGVPKEMPALAHASSIQRRVASVGFDWTDAAGALSKVAEESAELQQAANDEERRAELGDLLFALVSAARHMNLDAEEALRLANLRFMRRFTRLEALADRRGISLKEQPTEALEQLWREAKEAF